MGILVIRILTANQLTVKHIRLEPVLLKLCVPRITSYAYLQIVLQSGRVHPDIGNRISNFNMR